MPIPRSELIEIVRNNKDAIASEWLMRNLRLTALPGSICGVLSKIYFAVEDEEVRLDIRQAVAMAKRMGNKLKLIKAEKEGKVDS